MSVYTTGYKYMIGRRILDKYEFDCFKGCGACVWVLSVCMHAAVNVGSKLKPSEGHTHIEVCVSLHARMYDSPSSFLPAASFGSSFRFAQSTNVVSTENKSEAAFEFNTDIVLQRACTEHYRDIESET